MNKNSVSLKELAPKIASALGGGYCVTDPGDNFISIECGPVPFVLNRKGWGHEAGRIIVSLHCPRDRAGRIIGPSSVYPRPADTSISVSGERSADAIAKDIARRFLPAATEVYNLLLGYIAKNDGYHDLVADTAKRIAAEIPGATVSPRTTNAAAGVQVGYQACAVSKVEVMSDSVCVMLYTAPDRMVEILRTLKAANLL